MTDAALRPPEKDQITRDIACIRMHLEIAEVSKRTQALMPSIVNFKDALARLAAIEESVTRIPVANVPDPNNEAMVSAVAEALSNGPSSENYEKTRGFRLLYAKRVLAALATMGMKANDQ